MSITQLRSRPTRSDTWLGQIVECHGRRAVSGQIFHLGVILFREFGVDDLYDKFPVTLSQTGTNLGITNAAPGKSDFHFLHDRSYGSVIDQNPGPTPVELRIAVDNRELVAATP